MAERDEPDDLMMEIGSDERGYHLTYETTFDGRVYSTKRQYFSDGRIVIENVHTSGASRTTSYFPEHEAQGPHIRSYRLCDFPTRGVQRGVKIVTQNAENIEELEVNFSLGEEEFTAAYGFGGRIRSFMDRRFDSGSETVLFITPREDRFGQTTLTFESAVMDHVLYPGVSLGHSEEILLDQLVSIFGRTYIVRKKGHEYVVDKVNEADNAITRYRFLAQVDRAQMKWLTDAVATKYDWVTIPGMVKAKCEVISS